jgi:hypothetical protein
MTLDGRHEGKELFPGPRALAQGIGDEDAADDGPRRTAEASTEGNGVDGPKMKT